MQEGLVVTGQEMRRVGGEEIRGAVQDGLQDLIQERGTEQHHDLDRDPIWSPDQGLGESELDTVVALSGSYVAVFSIWNYLINMTSHVM